MPIPLRGPAAGHFLARYPRVVTLASKKLCVAVCAVLIGATARASLVVGTDPNPLPRPPSERLIIANGLDCSASTNVIEEPDPYEEFNLLIRDLGCSEVDLEVGCAFAGQPTVVCLAEDGAVAEDGWVRVEDSSLLVVEGAVTSGTLAWLAGRSRLEQTGGHFRKILLADDATATIDADEQLFSVEASGRARADVVAPNLFDAYAVDDSVLFVDGLIHFVTAEDRARVTVRSGPVLMGIFVEHSAAMVEVRGGRLEGQLRNRGTFRLLGGVRVGDIENDRRLELEGGRVEGDLLTGYSTLLTGTSIEGRIVLENFEYPGIAIAGSDFAIDGEPLGYGTHSDRTGHLTGVLANGAPLDTDIVTNGRCTDCPYPFELLDPVTLPEPGAATLAAVALAMLACLRERKQAR